MKRTLGLFAVVATAIVAAAASAFADTTEQQEMKSAQFLVGTWSCTHAEGDVSGTYTTTVTNSLGNHWLKQTYDFAATAAEPAMQGEWFVGYDGRTRRWVRLGAMSDGLYFAMVGKRVNDAWSWSYVLPGQSSSPATVYTKKSETEYTVEGPSYMMNGKPVTEHHTCKKLS